MTSLQSPARARGANARPAARHARRRASAQLLAAVGGVATTAVLGLGVSSASAATAYVGSGTAGNIGLIPVDLATGEVGTRFLPHPEARNVRRIVVSPDQRKVVAIGSTTDSQGYVSVIDSADDSVERSIKLASLTLGGTQGARVSPDGTTLYYTVGGGDSFRRIDLTTGTELPAVTLPGSSPNGAGGGFAFSRDGATAYVSSFGKLYGVDVATATVAGDPFSGSGFDPNVLHAGANGRYVFAWNPGSTGVARAIDVENGVANATLLPGSLFVGPDALAPTPDGERLWGLRDAAAQGQSLTALETATATLGSTVALGPLGFGTGRDDFVYALAMAPDNRTAWLGTETRALVAVDTQTGERIGNPVTLPVRPLRDAFAIALGEAAETSDPEITTVAQLESGGFHHGFAGVIGDPTQPTLPIALRQTDAQGSAVPGDRLTIANVQSSNPGVLAADKVTVTGSGLERRVAFEPVGPGRARVTLTVRGLDDKTGTFSFDYWVSRATTPTSRVLQGTSDLSTAQDVGDGHLLVADDEWNDIRLYDARTSGVSVNRFQVGPAGSEVDFESSARAGDTVYWLGSFVSGGEEYRQRVYKTRLIGRGADARLVVVGDHYDRLLVDLLRWDVANGSPLGMTRPHINIEGAEFAPGSTSTLYLGAREFVKPNKATIIPVTNFDKLHNGDGEKAEFAEPIHFELFDGEGYATIREIRKNRNDQYLILGGRSSYFEYGSLWSWSGERDDQPVLVRRLPASLEPAVDNHDGFETIGTLPDTFLPDGQVQLGLDQGEARLYEPDDMDNKNKRSSAAIYKQKARVDWFAFDNANVGAVAEADAPAFPAQPAATAGPGQWVTISNPGAQKLPVRDLRVQATGGSPAGEFLIAEETLEEDVVAPGGSFRVLVRFAPSRETATSTADLVVRSPSIAGGALRVPLTGTSTTLPQGPKGDDGGRGGDGQDGDDGANGKDGANGPKGDSGTPGAAGPKGDQGPAGRDGTFAFVAKRSAATPVRRGKVVRLAFEVRNDTAAAVKAFTATALTPKALRVTGKTSQRVKALGADQSRTIGVQLRIGRTAKLGTHRVRVRLNVGGTTVTRTVKVLVRR